MMTLKTRWADEAMCDLPLPEYPRPQMVRDSWVNLNGMFDYAVTDDKTEWPAAFDGQIRVPFAIESCLSGVCKKLGADERLWYRKTFTLPVDFTGKRVLLHFGAVDWKCHVFVNGNEVARHIGGYCPFSVDVTNVLQNGDNELIVKVYDPTDEGWQNRGKQASYSHGFWYTATSGIWQTVWLEAVPQTYIESFRLTPDIDTGVLKIATKTNNEGRLHIKVLDGETVVADRDITNDDAVAVPNAKLWSPESPFLYDFILTCGEDSVKGYFAMRKFSIGEHGGYARLFLNNEPYFQRGLLDQGYWSDGGLTPPTDEAMVYDIQTMKDLGFNMLRKHIKVEPARWYYHCDRLGMIVWQDMVSGGSSYAKPVVVYLPTLFPKVFGKMSDGPAYYKTFSRSSAEGRKEWLDEMQNTIHYLYNVPSIGTWVLFNEGWGQFNAAGATVMARELDDSRPIDQASGWFDEGSGDYRSVHNYFRPLVVEEDEAGRAFVISEYGGFSLHIDDHSSVERVYGYKKYATTDELGVAYYNLINGTLKPLVSKGLAGAVYTQLSDVEEEVNGLMTYDRKITKINPNLDPSMLSNMHQALKS